jgi:cytidylate kinase
MVDCLIIPLICGYFAHHTTASADQNFMPKIVIAIDGYSSCGKSTTAKQVAARMGYGYIDTGAMYRAVTLYFLQERVSFSNPKEVELALERIQITFNHNAKAGRNETCLNGLNVEEEIRKMYISNLVSEVSAIPEVRWSMVAQQQKMGRRRGVVMDGRDIGTKVFPDAEVKVFMTAETYIRAQRRQQELLAKGELVNLEEIIRNLEKRDLIDTTRAESPLVQAPDAVLLDTSHMTIEEQVDWVIELADRRLAELHRKKSHKIISQS